MTKSKKLTRAALTALALTAATLTAADGWKMAIVCYDVKAVR